MARTKKWDSGHTWAGVPYHGLKGWGCGWKRTCASWQRQHWCDHADFQPNTCGNQERICKTIRGISDFHWTSHYHVEVQLITFVWGLWRPERTSVCLSRDTWSPSRLSASPGVGGAAVRWPSCRRRWTSSGLRWPPPKDTRTTKCQLSGKEKGEGDAHSLQEKKLKLVNSVIFAFFQQTGFA